MRRSGVVRSRGIAEIKPPKKRDAESEHNAAPDDKKQEVVKGSTIAGAPAAELSISTPASTSSSSIAPAAKATGTIAAESAQAAVLPVISQANPGTPSLLENTPTPAQAPLAPAEAAAKKAADEIAVKTAIEAATDMAKLNEKGHNDAMTILLEVKKGNAMAIKNEKAIAALQTQALALQTSSSASSSSTSVAPLAAINNVVPAPAAVDTSLAALMKMQEERHTAMMAQMQSFQQQQQASMMQFMNQFAGPKPAAPAVPEHPVEDPFPGASLVGDQPRRTFISDTLSDPHTKLLVTEGKKLKRNIESHVRLNERHAKVKASIQILDNKTEEGPRYPAGMKPFKAPEKDTSYDETLLASIGKTVQLSINLPTDVSKRKAMAEIHRQAASMIKSVELEAIQQKIAASANGVTQASFTESCNGIQDPEEKEAREKVYPPGLPGPLPAIKTANMILVLAEAKSLYSSTLNEVVDKWNKKPDAANEDEVSTSVISSDPAQLLKTVIKAIIEEKMDKTKLEAANAASGDEPIGMDADEGSSDTDEISKNVDALVSGLQGERVPSSAKGRQKKDKKDKQDKKKKSKPRPSRRNRAAESEAAASSSSATKSKGKGKGKDPSLKGKGKGKGKGGKGKGKGKKGGKSGKVGPTMNASHWKAKGKGKGGKGKGKGKGKGSDW